MLLAGLAIVAIRYRHAATLAVGVFILPPRSSQYIRCYYVSGASLILAARRSFDFCLFGSKSTRVLLSYWGPAGHRTL